MILPIIDGATIQGGAGQNVVLIWRITPAVDNVAILSHRTLLAQVHEFAVQLIQVLCHHYSIGVVPGSKTDAVAGIDGWLAAFWAWTLR